MGKSELGVMLEPWTDREDIAAGESLEIIYNFDDDDDDIMIDAGDDSFVSIWCPPRTIIKKIE